VKKTEVIYDDLGFVIEYRCPYCGGSLSLDDGSRDDVGTTFFTCPKCGETSSLAKSEERMRLEKSLEEQKRLDEARKFSLRRVFEAHGTNIEVLNQAEMKSPQQELADDLITIISHFAGKIYGLRSHKHKEVVERAKNLFTQA
jgi:ribosomal protein S27AE